MYPPNLIVAAVEQSGQAQTCVAGQAAVGADSQPFDHIAQLPEALKVPRQQDDGDDDPKKGQKEVETVLRSHVSHLDVVVLAAAPSLTLAL